MPSTNGAAWMSASPGRTIPAGGAGVPFRRVVDLPQQAVIRPDGRAMPGRFVNLKKSAVSTNQGCLHNEEKR